MPKREAIIFDMDGLMVDSEPLSRRAWDLTLAAYGHQLSDDVYNQVIGRRLDQVTQLLQKAYRPPVSIEELAAKKADTYHEIRAQGVPAMPGLMALQSAIKQRGIPWAVATSSPRGHAEIILTQLGLINDCYAIAAGNEVENGKPNPEIYLLAASRLGIDPETCLALEDSEPGCQAASAAGMKTIAIPNGGTTAGEFLCADARYSSLQQVADTLDTLLEY